MELSRMLLLCIVSTALGLPYLDRPSVDQLAIGSAADVGGTSEQEASPFKAKAAQFTSSLVLVEFLTAKGPIELSVNLSQDLILSEETTVFSDDVEKLRIVDIKEPSGAIGAEVDWVRCVLSLSGDTKTWDDPSGIEDDVVSLIFTSKDKWINLIGLMDVYESATLACSIP